MDENCVYLIGVLENLGKLELRKGGEFEKFEEFQVKALRVCEKIFEENCIQSIKIIEVLGDEYAERNLFEKAVFYYRKYMKIDEKYHGIGSLDSGYIWENLGSVYEF